MSSATIDPIAPEWSTSEGPSATAHQLALALARFEVHEIEAWDAELRAAVAELSAAAGRTWIFDDRDVTVALLRATSVLAGRSPEVAGTQAAVLVAALGGETRQGSNRDRVERHGRSSGWL